MSFLKGGNLPIIATSTFFLNRAGFSGDSVI